jgi:hypothetical protein
MEKVIVDDPQWRDATGKVYGPGKRHGMTGVVVRRTGYKCGRNEIVEVDFGAEGIHNHWSEDLKFERPKTGGDIGPQDRLF